MKPVKATVTTKLGRPKVKKYDSWEVWIPQHGEWIYDDCFSSAEAADEYVAERDSTTAIVHIAIPAVR